MTRFFIDTNIIIDLIAERKPHSKFAILLFSAAEQNKLKLFTSSHSIATTYYILKKVSDEKTLRTILLHLLDFVQPVAVDKNIITRALNSNHADVEDAIQIMAASMISNINGIVTRNIKDFKNSDIPVWTPDQAVKMI